MKKAFSYCFIVFIIFSATSQTTTNNYQKLWEKVYRFELDLLPKSANTNVEKIYVKAKKENNTPQIIKALLYKSKFALTLEENSELKVIQQLQAEIEQASAPTKNILENILAKLYWDYFQQNRWIFYNRTKTATKINSTDFRTWDSKTIFSEIHKHYHNSLKEETITQKIPLENYTAILNNVAESKTYRPTLFDFLSHNALDFFKTDEYSIDKPNYKFEINTPRFISHFETEDFSNKDSLSQELNALKIYQKVVQFHKKDTNPTAYITAILEALDYISEKGVLTNKQEILLDTYKKLRDRYRHHAISTQIDFKIAEIYKVQAATYIPNANETHRYQNKKAIEICELAVKLFPKSNGASNCSVLKNQILDNSFRITAEKNIPSNTASRLLVEYKNTDSLFFNIYKISHKQAAEYAKMNKEANRINFIKKLNNVSSWNAKFRNENDYQNHTTEIKVPALPLGKYLIFSTLENNNLSTTNTNAITILQVTDLAIIDGRENDKYTFQVVDRNTGKPIENASVNLKNNTSDHYNKSINKDFTTDTNGQFYYENKDFHRNVIATIKTAKETATFGDYYMYNYRNPRSIETNKTTIQPFLFTDRSIYRPGQKAYFKAIILKKNNDKSEVTTEEFVAIVFKNPNGQVVKSLDLKLNEYGAVSGEFDIPDNGLTGNYYFEIKESQSHKSDFYKTKNFNFLRASNYSISVEEYKRPKFKTSFLPVNKTFKLNDTITVSGSATAFSGNIISDAKVKYRVVRNTNYPIWYRRYATNFYPSESLEITHGETNSNAKGIYKINFKALPDLKTPKENQPTFHYTIYADVTDLNGETHSTETVVKVGYHTLETSISMDDRIDRCKRNNTIRIDSKNLNGQFVTTQGVVKIYKLQAPKNPFRERTWEAPDYQDISAEDFEILYPNDAYISSKQKDWKKGTLVFEQNFDTKASKIIQLKRIKKWTSGAYIVVIEAKDKFDQLVKNEKIVTVFAPTDKKVADNSLIYIETNKNDYKPNDKVKLKIGSASKNITVTLEVEKEHKIISRHFVHLNNEIKTIKIPVTAKDRGGFAIKWHAVNYNSFLKGTLLISVPHEEKNLAIETLTFRDKLEPGAQQTWAFKIKGDKKESIAAEILASMYDASLDEFKNHDWSFNPSPKSYYSSYNNTSATTSFGTKNFRIHNESYTSYSFKSQNYDQLNWFGFNLRNNSYLNKVYLKNLYIQRTTFDWVLSGVVTDEKGQALPGVSIRIKNTAFGTTTNFDGAYSLKIKKNDLVTFNYLGFETYEEKINKVKLDVQLKTSNQSLEKVVIRGYGTIKKKNISGAMSVLNNDVVIEVDEAEEVILESTETDEEVITETPKLEQELLQIQARTNFKETAFFFPHLRTDADGTIHFEFTMPEALTAWKMQLLAHTKDLRTATNTQIAVTQKKLMVTPNAPRFLREGDEITISSKISSLSEETLNGFAQLHLTDALTGNDINLLLDNTIQNQDFSLAANGNTQVSWTLQIPENIQAVQYKIVAKAGDFSDGEQNVLPVLSNRTLVTETLPIWVNSNETKTFTLEKLKNNASKTAKNHKLTLEMTSNPAWYALQALPYLMEYPYECAEQNFSRYYANSLGSHLVNSNPKIKEVFEKWSATEALLSNLEKNQELKSIIIQETPWLRDAQSETEQKKRIALLFDLQKMENQLAKTIDKLAQMQMSNGGFPWFKGSGYANRNITQHIAAGFGHLKILGVENNSTKEKQIIQKILPFLDSEIENDYEKLLQHATKTREKATTKKKGLEAEKKFLESKHISSSQLHYLYTRSFYKNRSVSKNSLAAVNYYKKQMTNYWKEFSLYNKALTALVLHREDNSVLSKKILASLKENSITSEELGMYWKENKASWYWYQSPIETQSLLIEVFAEIENNTKTIDALKKWLLKNKQTNRWKTTKATTEAVYALLLQGSDWLSIDENLEIMQGGQILDPKKLADTKIEAGTGYFKTSWNSKEITAEMGSITVTKKEKGMAWGGLYWQYFEDLDKITSTTTSLKIDKKLFLKTNSDSGKILTEIDKKTTLKVGDLMTVRIEISTDRDLEFIHMKDMRAAGVEPIDVISKYKYQDGLGYYQSTKDASTHFFFDHIRKGIYVFEYDVRINNAGIFSNGITTIQSMYAPEFSSHSTGEKIEVK